MGEALVLIVKPIGLKWVFKVKSDSAEQLITYKARLVVRGYAQSYGVDFTDVKFAPVPEYRQLEFS